MATCIYLYLDFIPGESTVTGFDSWIDITSFSLGCTMEVDQEARSGSGGGTSGTADPEDLSLDKKMDIATPTLLYCCATGVVIPRAKLMQLKDSDDRLPVSEYAFGNSIITNVNLNGSGGNIPDESMTLNYGSVSWRYYCYDHYNTSVPVKGRSGTGPGTRGEFQRSWSLISSNPGDPDTSTTSAMKIGLEYDAEPPKQKPEDWEHPNSYWSIGRGNAPSGLVEGEPDFRMPKPGSTSR